jgi:peptidoglycan hydrolase-like protein with peptidoglycan-binding domain
MAAYTGLKRGSSGEQVKQLQEILVANGANITVDGQFGPATEAALKAYQKENGYQENGQVGGTLAGIMGIDLAGAGEAGTGSKPVATSKDGSELLMPTENTELWYNSETQEWMIVQVMPGVKLPDGSTSEPVYTSWVVESDEDLEAVIGPDAKAKAARIVTDDQLTSLGVVDFGGIDELRDWGGLEGDPFETYVEDMAVLAITRPWVLDADYAALAIMAVMEREDGQLSIDEIQTTEWYRTHSDTERRWMEVSHGDPATAARWEADSRAATAEKLRMAGIDNVPEPVANWMAAQVVHGTWSQEKLDLQIRALADPYSQIAPDAALMQEVSDAEWSPDETRAKEDDVQALLDKWLGPVFGNATQKEIAQRAGDLRNDPDGELEFIEYLKDQRLALFPGHEDRNVSYQDLARPWKSFQQQAWGQQAVDETDPMFIKLIQNNDAAVNGEMLNREGLKRDVGKVVNDTRAAMADAFGGVVL